MKPPPSFHMIGDGHQPDSVGVYIHVRRIIYLLIRWDFPIEGWKIVVTYSSTPSPYSEMENEQRMVFHQMDQPKEMSRLFMSLIHVHRIFVSCE